MLRRLVSMLTALTLLFCAVPARAETAATEYLVNMTGGEIGALERRLGALGYLSGEPDEVYDAETRLAVESFQQANGLDVTGQLDDVTLERLDGADAVSRQEYLRRFTEAYREMEPLKNGDINNQVQVMQRRLNEYGYFSGAADGVFGDATQMAVERFQMVNGLSVTGEADGMTLMRLMAEVPITWQGYLSEMSAAAGDAGLNVYVLQKKLSAMGYFDGDCTGSFGDLTQQAVAQFQADNELDDTGIADAATWALIYSGNAVARRRADVLQMGDAGDTVARIQERLLALGYYGRDASGSFDYLTETAVRLFQMANGLPSSGEADGDTLGVLMSDAALPVGSDAVQANYAALMDGRSDTIQAVISEIAAQMLGSEFETPDDALYPGFALVQYVCVAAGLPITRPETLIQLADDPVESGGEVEAGNIVAFQRVSSDSVTMLLTIGAGDGRVVYAVPEIGWVVMSYIDQMEGVSVYRWADGAA